MAIDFPPASSSPWLGPNNVTYTYVGTEPNGYWKGSTTSANIGDGTITLTSNGSSISNGNFTVNQTGNQTIDIPGGSSVSNTSDLNNDGDNAFDGDKFALESSVPTKTSDLTNDGSGSGQFITSGGAPVQSVNGQTGVVTISTGNTVTKTSDLTNDGEGSGKFITSGGAPVQSVNGQTGTVTISTGSNVTDNSQIGNGAGYITRTSLWRNYEDSNGMFEAASLEASFPLPSGNFALGQNYPNAPGNTGLWINANSSVGTWIHMMGGYQSNQNKCGIMFSPTFGNAGAAGGSYLRAVPISNSASNLHMGYTDNNGPTSSTQYDKIKFDIYSGSVTAQSAFISNNFIIELNNNDDSQFEDVSEDFDTHDQETGAYIETNTITQRVYKGAKLDVRERILNFQSRLAAMEANEVIDDATDNALLQLVANLSNRLDLKDQQLTDALDRISALEAS